MLNKLKIKIKKGKISVKIGRGKGQKLCIESKNQGIRGGGSSLEGRYHC
jgi:hypothetical protein